MLSPNLASAFRLNPSQSRAVIVGLLRLEEMLTNNSISNLLEVQSSTSLSWLCHLSRTSKAEDESISLYIKALCPEVLPLLLGRPRAGVRPEP